MTTLAHNISTFEYAHPFPTEVKNSLTNSSIVKAIHRSQHTQRNFNREKVMPIEDIKTIITAATQCPSKQNLAFYDLHIVQNHDVIDEIYKTTTNITMKPEARVGNERLSNPQVLANLLLVFTQSDFMNSSKVNHKNLRDLREGTSSKVNHKRILEADMHQAAGIAAEYVNIVSTLLGYETGCCRCVMDNEKLLSLLGIDKKVPILLLMGVGFKNDGMNRRIHPLKDSKEHDINEWEDVFRTFKKEPIKINYIK